MTSPKSSYTSQKANSSKWNVANENALLDKLLRGFNIKNDAQLATWLGIDKSLVYAVRAGKRRLGLLQRLKILDHIGYLRARSLVESILPENLARELVAIDEREANERIALNSTLRGLNSDVALLDVTKAIYGYETDAALAEFLVIECNTVSTIRAGKSGLGPKPRLRILERLTKAFDFNALVRIIDSTTALNQLLDQSLRGGKRALSRDSAGHSD